MYGFIRTQTCISRETRSVLAPPRQILGSADALYEPSRPRQPVTHIPLADFLSVDHVQATASTCVIFHRITRFVTSATFPIFLRAAGYLFDSLPTEPTYEPVQPAYLQTLTGQSNPSKHSFPPLFSNGLHLR